LPSTFSGIIGIYSFNETLVSSFVEGVVTLASLLSQMVNNKAVPRDKVEKVMVRHFRKVNLDTTLARLARIFEKEPYAVVVRSETYFERKLNIIIHYLLNIRSYVKSLFQYLCFTLC
jgi:predicted transcriptional regulator